MRDRRVEVHVELRAVAGERREQHVRRRRELVLRHVDRPVARVVRVVRLLGSRSGHGRDQCRHRRLREPHARERRRRASARPDGHVDRPERRAAERERHLRRCARVAVPLRHVDHNVDRPRGRRLWGRVHRGDDEIRPEPGGRRLPQHVRPRLGLDEHVRLHPQAALHASERDHDLPSRSGDVGEVADVGELAVRVVGLELRLLQLGHGRAARRGRDVDRECPRPSAR